MTAPTAVFTCSICNEASNNICAYCTKDACANHRCERCKRCSDCCECEVPLSAEEAAAAEAAAQVESAPPEALPAEAPQPAAAFLTVEESAVFSEPYVPDEPPSHEPTSQRPPADYERSE
ncbi:MAG TPA: hypothetical protein VFW44_08695 [Bryobacteraceae bacterium]|nr:hypothetical protein [Bryobacteraceae bacterium]